MENIEELYDWENMEKKRMEQYYKSLNQNNFQNLNNKQNNWQSLNEVQNLNKKQNDWQSLNEINDLKKYNQYENLNDGLGIDFDFEVRVNGVVQNKKQNHPFHQKSTSYPFDIKLNDDKPLNEVVKFEQPKVEEKVQKIEESLENVEVVSWELFNRINEKGMMRIYEDNFKK